MALPFAELFSSGTLGPFGRFAPDAPPPSVMSSYQASSPYPVNATAQLPEYSGLEQALMGQSQRSFTDPGGTLDLLRQQFSASGLGNSGTLLGAQQRAETQRQGGLAEQLAQLRVQRAMAQLEQRRFADQLGFQDYQGNLNRDFQAQQGDLQFQRQQQMIQQQRDYEDQQRQSNLIGTILSGGLSLLTGGIGGALMGGVTGGGLGGALMGAFAGPGALAGAGLQQHQLFNILSSPAGRALYNPGSNTSTYSPFSYQPQRNGGPYGGYTKPLGLK